MVRNEPSTSSGTLMPRRIAFLVPGPAVAGHANDNHQRLPAAFAAAGWQVARLDRDSLAVDAGCLAALALNPDDAAGERTDLSDFDRYFLLGFGPAETFLDRMQMLASLPAARFVNTPTALVFQHGKISLALACPDVPQPRGYLSNDPQALAARVASGGAWIAKPPAGSFGRDVFRLHAGDSNVAAILSHLTRDGRYALLQEYVAAAEGDEVRALVAGGQVLGAYRKVPADHRGNLQAGARAVPAALSPAADRTLALLAPRLETLGVRFAAVDVAGDQVLEINIANPGWLQTYETIAGENLAPKVVDALA